MDFVVEGGCFCGAVRYRVVGRAFRVTHCHCKNCRKLSGAPFVTWAEFKSEDFAFTKGKAAEHVSENEVVRTFCGRCGTSLTDRRGDSPEAIDVTVGSMDDPEVIEPQDHTWTIRQLSWIRLSDGLPRYEKKRASQ